VQHLRITLKTNSEAETLNVGRQVGKLLSSGDIVALIGDLGAGKTCLVKGIAQGLQVPEDSYVRSPSFIILNIYEGRFPLYHMDLYRIHGQEEVEELGYKDIFYGNGATVIEWADKIPDLLPRQHLRFSFSFEGETGRSIEIAAHGERYRKAWERWSKALLPFS